LTTIHNLSFENENRLRASLKALRDGADLADELIIRSCRDQGSKAFATFDKGIVRRHKPYAAEP
jgi:predicted nucleic acid-binding protein